VTPARVDVRAFACPITWVKTRMALERLGQGDRLEVWLREGEPLRSVPRSAEEDGHAVAAIEPLPGAPDGCWRVVLVKGAPPPALP
jgi:tRNA 2-thiouridine synthesizing protein A